MISFLQAIILGLFQGVSELFPISSLGHSVLLTDLFGWHNILNAQTQNESFFLSFLVILHVATALALLIFYRREWYRIISGFFSSIRQRQVQTPYEKLAWLLIIATIPAGLIGLLLEHKLRTQFAKPASAAIFLMINGVILLIGDQAQKRDKKRENFNTDITAENTAKHLTTTKAGIIGLAQVSALMAGISRSGVTMVSGLYSGLDYEDSARFSFLLATPIILAAGLYKLPDFLGSNGDGIRGQTLAGGLAAGVAAYLTVRFLDKYFQNKRLWPFAVYCLVFGAFMFVFQMVRG